jgi:hypothetical protein
MKKKQKTERKYTSSTLRLSDKHSWTAPDGYKIMVIDRGAASFNIPGDWLIKKFDPLEIHDADPPNDKARLMVTIWRFPPGIDWTGLPLAPMLMQAVTHDEKEDGEKRDLLKTGKIQSIVRPDLEVAWVQQHFMDPVEKREAISRIAIVRSPQVQLLVTLDYWPEDAKRCVPHWDELIRSLQTERVIKDPLKGPTLH